MERDHPSFWFTVGHDGVLLRDNEEVARTCMMANYALIHNKLGRAQLMSGATGFQGAVPPPAPLDEWEGFEDLQWPVGPSYEEWQSNPFESTPQTAIFTGD